MDIKSGLHLILGFRWGRRLISLSLNFLNSKIKIWTPASQSCVYKMRECILEFLLHAQAKWKIPDLTKTNPMEWRWREGLQAVERTLAGKRGQGPEGGCLGKLSASARLGREECSVPWMVGTQAEGI